jgi:hypothetical protein
MKKYSIFFSAFIFTLSFSQNTKSYCYKTRFFSEGINLKKNGTFDYNIRINGGVNQEINGNWQIRNDSILVLDSYPQKSKLIVSENLKRGKKIIFRVRDSDERMINYNIYIITEKKDTIYYKNQFGKSVIKEKPKSFYLVNTSGLYSPIYIIKGKNTNFFEIRFEHWRVFENEYWKIHGDKIVPLGMNGQYVNYFMKEN